MIAKISQRFITLTDIDPYDYVRKVHEGRRSWSNQVQKAMVIGELMKRSDEYQDIQQQIRDERNRKLAEARAEQAAPNPAGANQYDKERLAVPQTLAQPTINIDQPPINQVQKTLVANESIGSMKQHIDYHTEQENRKPVEPARPPFSYPAVQSPPKQPERTTAVVAAKIGVNRGAVEQAQTIQEKRPTDPSTPIVTPPHSAEPNPLGPPIADQALSANRLFSTPLETPTA